VVSLTKLTITHKTPKVAVKIAMQSKRVFQGGVPESRRLGSHPTSIRRRFYKQKVLADLLSNLETRMRILRGIPCLRGDR
jgi:hypothetical protein